jgi:indole-3-glycerol phosphate synthase
MKESRRVLHLVMEAFPPAKMEEVRQLTAQSAQAEMFTLTETNSHEALEKIFAADAVTVWGPLVDADKRP